MGVERSVPEPPEVIHTSPVTCNTTIDSKNASCFLSLLPVDLRLVVDRLIAMNVWRSGLMTQLVTERMPKGKQDERVMLRSGEDVLIRHKSEGRIMQMIAMLTPPYESRLRKDSLPIRLVPGTRQTIERERERESSQLLRFRSFND